MTRIGSLHGAQKNKVTNERKLPRININTSNLLLSSPGVLSLILTHGTTVHVLTTDLRQVSVRCNAAEHHAPVNPEYQ